MSQVYDALRDAEQEAKEKLKHLSKDEERPAGHTCPAAQAAVVEQTTKPIEARDTAWVFEERLGALLDRMEAGRDFLEGVLHRAEEMSEELRRSQQRIQDTGLEAFRAAVMAIKAGFQDEIERLSQGAIAQAEKQFGEKTSVAAAADRIERTFGRLEEEAGRRMQRKAENLVETAAELFGKQAEESLDAFRAELAAAAGKIVGQTESEFGRARTHLQSLAREVRSEIESAWGESRETIQVFRKKGVRELEDELQKVVKERLNTVLESVVSQSVHPAQDKPFESGTAAGEPEIAVRNDHQLEAENAATGRMDSQTDNLEFFATNFKSTLDAFHQQTSELCSSIFEHHRESLDLMVDDLRDRLLESAETSARN